MSLHHQEKLKQGGTSGTNKFRVAGAFTGNNPLHWVVDGESKVVNNVEENNFGETAL